MKNRTAYSAIVFLFLFLCCNSDLFSQMKLMSVKKTVQPAASLVMRNLPAPPMDNIPKTKIQVPNEEETEEMATPRKKKLPQTKPIYLPSIVTPQLTNNIQENLRSQINEVPCISYAGINRNNGAASSFNTIFPADVGGTVGFDHLFLTLNNRLRIQDKTGTILREEDQQNPIGFWASAGLNVSNLFDPKIIYDPYQNRWVYVIDAGGRDSPNSALYVAVSHGADPMGGWTIYNIDTDAENDNWADYPSIGFNKNWIVINVNMIKNTGTSASSVSRTFVLDKLQLYASGFVNYTTYDAATSPFKYWTICPAKVYDPNYNDIWCATNDDVDDNDIRFFKITGSPSSPTMTEEGYVSIGTDWAGGGDNMGPQLGSSVKIDLGFDWVQSAVWRNNKLFFAQNLFTPDVSNPTDATLQVVSCNPVTETVHEAIRFSSNVNNMYAYPNLVVNNNEDWIISCQKFTTAIYPSAAVIVRRNGNANFTETIFKAGEDIYTTAGTDGRVRWGDYSTAAIDPSDDNSVWVAGEYSLPRVSTTGQWSTWWAKICSGICNNVTNVAVTQTTGTMSKWEAGHTVNASSTIQSGANIKLDAGVRVIMHPGFRANAGSKLRAFIEGCGGVQ